MCDCRVSGLEIDPFNRIENYEKLFKYFIGTKWPKHPMKIFDDWFQEAQKFKHQKPNCMCLATAGKNKIPSSRIVALKGYGEGGFLFFTDYASQKARELDENPCCALTFFWEASKRQVRIEGCAVRISTEDNDKYFEEQPCTKKLLAMMGPQSGVVKDKLALCDWLSDLQEKYLKPGAVIQRPSCWGGYIVRPDSVEFNEILNSIIHDRIRFTKNSSSNVLDCYHQGEDGWCYQFLKP